MMMMTKMTTICFAHCSFQTNVSRLPSAQNHFEADDDDNGDGDGDGGGTIVVIMIMVVMVMMMVMKMGVMVMMVILSTSRAATKLGVGNKSNFSITIIFQ